MPGVGGFLAYQFAIDMGYSTLVAHDENEFVVAGPGALDGLSKVFPNMNLRDAAQVIRVLTETQDDWFERLGLQFGGLFGRPLHLIDVQNLFCEVSKYTRVTHPQYTGCVGSDQDQADLSAGRCAPDTVVSAQVGTRPR